MKTLNELYELHSGTGKFNDKNSVHSYISVYQELFEPIRVICRSMLEIGIFDGHSLRMWEQYFHNAICSGIDISDQPLGMVDLRPMIAENVHDIHILNACDRDAVEKVFKDRTFDVIIDDASHNIDDQIKSFELFVPKLIVGGIYVIEDIQDIDRDGWRFVQRGFNIVDRRHIKNRYDDVLAIFRKESCNEE